MKISIEDLRDGDLILFHSHGFQPMSWAIRTLTHSYWNHVGIYNAGFVIEARKTVEKNSIDNYLNEKFDLGIFRIKKDSFLTGLEYKDGLQSATTYAEARVGSNYDKRAIVWLGIKYLSVGFLRKLIPQRYNPFQKREQFFCSELVCECYYKTSSIVKNLFAGLKYLLATCGTCTPKDIGKSIHSKWVMGTNKI